MRVVPWDGAGLGWAGREVANGHLVTNWKRLKLAQDTSVLLEHSGWVGQGCHPATELPRAGPSSSAQQRDEEHPPEQRPSLNPRMGWVGP